MISKRIVMLAFYKTQQEYAWYLDVDSASVEDLIGVAAEFQEESYALPEFDWQLQEIIDYFFKKISELHNSSEEASPKEFELIAV